MGKLPLIMYRCIFMFLLLCTSCVEQKDTTSIKIDLMATDSDTLYYSSFVDSLSYIPFETGHRFFACYYFKAKKPYAYIKSMATHRLNKMFVWEHTLQTFEAVSKPIQNFLNNNLIMVNLTNGTVFT